MGGWPEDVGMTLVFAPQEDTKTCPRCGERLFADMDVCYGCLYDFSKENEQMPTESYGGNEDVGEAGERRCLRISSRLMDVEVPLPQKGLLVGRSSECDVVLHARAVSRTHVRIEPCEGGALATDLSARNPATIRGRPVGEGAVMRAEDELSVCGITFTLL